MAKKQLRGKAGNVAKYITRTRAVKRLQLRLAEFRRLCILKGIHPREPKKKVQGQNKTYYHLKDINFLAHEPLLESFRAISAHERKVKKARARRNADLANQLLKRTPTYRLDHLVRERYPTFQDALRDVDDALCMVHLFAVLPASEQHAIPPAVLLMSRRLVLEWQALMCRMHALRKAFISVKGFYLQAAVHDVSVTWIMPHATSQILPKDVDMRVMLTFLEFYHSLLRFVMFKLYHDQGLQYPPVVRPEKEKIAAELDDIIQDLSGAQRSVQDRIAAEKESAANKLLLDDTCEGRTAGSGPSNHVAASGHATLADAPSPSPETASKKLPSVEDKADKQGAGSAGMSGEPHEEGGDAAEGGSDEDGELLIDSGDEEDDDSGSDDDDELWSGGEEGGLVGDAGEGDEDMYEQAELDQVLRMRLAEAEAASQGHVAAGAAAGDMRAMEERFGKEAVAAAGGAVATGSDSDAAVCGKLFSGMVFWLSREVPREVLMLVLRCYGGTAAWEGPGSPLPEDSEAITHHVMDRPHATHRRMGRMYIQPQWLFDCANFRVAVAASDYAPGKRPPPHLSPFESYDEGDYIPEAAARLKRLQAAAAEVRRAPLEATEMVGGVATGADAAIADGEGAEGDTRDASAKHEAVVQERFETELGQEIGATAGTVTPAKRKAQAASDGGADDVMSDAQKKVFMSRKERKVFDSLRKAEDAKASKAETLRKKKVALAK